MHCDDLINSKSQKKKYERDGCEFFFINFFFIKGLSIVLKYVYVFISFLG